MTDNQPRLLDSHDAPPPNHISAKCRFIDNEFQRLVFGNGDLAHGYDRNDQLAVRQVWTMVYVAGLATYLEIATATGISCRAPQYWVQCYREEGAAGLIDRAQEPQGG